ncbi:MAG: hypothetical protein ACKOJF_09995, partial [Planctomycetaceae bacterium]
ANEIREEEGMDPIPGEEGDAYLINGNMVPISVAMSAQPAGAPAPVVTVTEDPKDAKNLDPQQDEQIRGAFVEVLAGAVIRSSNKQALQAKQAAKKPSQFLSWLDEFYDGHRPELLEAVSPIVRAYTLATGRAISPGDVVDCHLRQRKAELLEVSGKATPDLLGTMIENAVTRWNLDSVRTFASEVCHG